MNLHVNKSLSIINHKNVVKSNHKYKYFYSRATEIELRCRCLIQDSLQWKTNTKDTADGRGQQKCEVIASS